MAAHEDDWNVSVGFGEFGLKVQSAQPGQSDVQHEAAGNINMCFVEKAVGGVEGFSLQTYRT